MAIGFIDSFDTADEIKRELLGQNELSETEEQTEVIQNPVVTISIEDYGIVTIELYPEMAPNTVANFIYLIKSKYYEGRTFDRVAENFLIQCGKERSEYSIKGEFIENGYENNTLKVERGTIRVRKTRLFIYLWRYE